MKQTINNLSARISAFIQYVTTKLVPTVKRKVVRATKAAVTVVADVIEATAEKAVDILEETVIPFVEEKIVKPVRTRKPRVAVAVVEAAPTIASPQTTQINSLIAGISSLDPVLGAQISESFTNEFNRTQETIKDIIARIIAKIINMVKRVIDTIANIVRAIVNGIGSMLG